MKGFIKLTERNYCANLLFNVSRIEVIKDFRTDPTNKNKKSFQWTTIVSGGRTYDVMETEEEICKLITESTH